MSTEKPSLYACFESETLVSHGPLEEVASAARRRLDEQPDAILALFADDTGRPVDLDLRGSVSDVLARLRGPPMEPRPRGRPRLGVVAKEVTLLPRHWEWLAGQPGGASVTLRKLVESARRASSPADATRRAEEATYCFMSSMAGNYPGFEEASRALFAHDYPRLDALIAGWPVDIRDHVRRLLDPAARGA